MKQTAVPGRAVTQQRPPAHLHAALPLLETLQGEGHQLAGQAGLQRRQLSRHLALRRAGREQKQQALQRCAWPGLALATQRCWQLHRAAVHAAGSQIGPPPHLQLWGRAVAAQQVSCHLQHTGSRHKIAVLLGMHLRGRV